MKKTFLPSLKIVSCLIAVYLVGFALTFVNFDSAQQDKAGQYKFDNSTIALKVLEQIDVYHPVPDYYFNNFGTSKNNYDVVFFGLKSDDSYCDKHRKFFVENPEFNFNNISYLADFNKVNFIRTNILSQIANNTHPHIGFHMPKNELEQPLYDINPSTNIFVTITAINQYQKLGKQFSCMTQMSNHIPGHWSMCRKDYVAESIIKYQKYYEDRPQCFTYDKFFPKTWLLYNKEDCQNFFAIFNSEEYQKLKQERRIVYIRKLAALSHRGDGVQPVNDQEEADLRSVYGNGSLCGQVDRNYVVQNYVHNPLLINGRKFDFRMYLLIASTNPMIAYYHDGGLRVSLVPYDVESDDRKGLLTNFALNHDIYKEARNGNLFQGKTEEELMIEQQWSFERFQEYLLQAGVVSDPNWLDNYLRPEFKKAYIHLIRLARYSYLKDSTVFELYGVDFMLDDKMNLWFIESNSGPAYGGYAEDLKKFSTKALFDHFEIITGLLKSRTKRIINYVNKIIREDLVKQIEGGEIFIQDLPQRIKEFEEVTRNYFEKEFEPNSNNGFFKILDENQEGIEAYQGLLEPECL